MAIITLLLWIGLVLLMIVSAIELSFISATVGWLHARAGQSFLIAYDGSFYSLHGKPLDLITNQGHTSNGTAGTALILIGFGGIVALLLRQRANFANSLFSKIWYHAWLALNPLALLLTLAALIYTFVVTNAHANQTIDQGMASQLHNAPYPLQNPYPLSSWTPENWLGAMLTQLDFAYDSERKDVLHHWRIARGWRYNLVPFFIIQLAFTVLVYVEAFSRRSRARAAKEQRSSTSGSY